MKERIKSKQIATKKSFGKRLIEDLGRNHTLYFMILPLVIYYLLFSYLPMVGVLIAFKDYRSVLGNSFLENIIQSKWVGFDNFVKFFTSPSFWKVLRNTINISLQSILVGFPAPIILALLFNELRSMKYKKVLQTVTYLPHFISLVVVCGIIRAFTADDGIITWVISHITGQEPSNMLLHSKYFVPILVWSDVWQGVGWGSIIYMSALAGVNEELYEAASIDGAGRFKLVWHITLPSILPTIAIMLILRLGSVLNVGYEKILLLYNDMTKDVGEIISTYVYQRGLIGRDYSYSTAVNLFQSVINIIFLVSANKISGRLTETSLW